MKIVVFGDEGRVGVLDGDHVVDLNRADAAIPARLDAFIQAGIPALELAERALRRSSAALPLDQIRLRSPWPGRRIACMGDNYADHLVDEASPQTVEPGEGGCAPSCCKPADAGAFTRFAPCGPSGAALTPLS